MEAMVALFNSAPIQKTTGMTLRYNEEGQAIFDWPRNAAFDHAGRDTHGGIFATLLDNAGWFTAVVPYDSMIVTVELSSRLLEPAKQEDLQAIGRLVRVGRRLCVADMEVRSSSDRLVAIGTGTFTCVGL